MGFLGGLLGTNSNYQYDPQGINFGADVKASQLNQNVVRDQEQALAQQYQQNAMGQGPNPAQQMMNAGIQSANAQNAGLIASQKGINPALAQRLAAQNAAINSQQAAQQGAILQAQQQLAAQNQLSGLYGQMGQQNLYQQSLGQQGINAANQINYGVAQQNAQNNANMVGGLMNAAGTIASGGLLGAGEALGSAAQGVGGGTGGISGYNYNQSPKEFFGMAEGGEVHQGNDLHSFLDGLINAKDGGKVPGTPKVKGNSYKNDTVPAMLSPGEVVIPNSVMQSSDPVSGAAKFVQAVMAKKKRMVK